MSRVLRTASWVGREGVTKALEEKELRPVDLQRAARSRAWALRHGASGTARLVVVAGVQRSGTNMLLRALRAAPECQVIDEGDRRAFRRFRLVDDATVKALVNTSRHRAVVIKPLCDAHRTPALLDLLPGDDAVGIWAWRDVDGASWSNVARFGNHALDVVHEIATSTRPSCWQAEGLSDEVLSVLRSLGRSIAEPVEAAALVWWARNRLALDMGLAGDPRVLPVRYDALRTAPQVELKRACMHIGVNYRLDLQTEFDPGRAPPRVAALRPAVRERCDQLTAALESWTSRPSPRP